MSKNTDLPLNNVSVQIPWRGELTQTSSTMPERPHSNKIPAGYRFQPVGDYDGGAEDYALRGHEEGLWLEIGNKTLWILPQLGLIHFYEDGAESTAEGTAYLTVDYDNQSRSTTGDQGQRVDDRNPQESR